MQDNVTSRFLFMEKKLNAIAEDLMKRNDDTESELPSPAENLDELDVLLQNPILVRTFQ